MAFFADPKRKEKKGNKFFASLRIIVAKGPRNFEEISKEGRHISMIYIGNQRSMDNFIRGTKLDMKETYNELVRQYKEMNEDNIDHICDCIEELHMLYLQYNNVKKNLEEGNVACWTKQY